MNLLVTKRQKDILSTIYNHIKNSGYPPTFEEMKESLGVSSNQSIIDLLTKLESKKIISRNGSSARSLTILPVGYEILGVRPLVPFLGISHAGAPVGMLDVQGEWKEIPGGLKQLESNVFLLSVTGDSMINAGIDDGDSVLVQTRSEFISGDIVLAEIDGESTIKRFVSEDKPPYLYLKPENPKYPIIYFNEKVTLKGKIVSVLKNNANT